MSKILEVLNKYCEKNRTSIRALEEKAGIGNGTIGRWGESTPNLKTLKKISDTTNIPISKLVN